VTKGGVEQKGGGFEALRRRIGLFLGPALALAILFSPLDLPGAESKRLLAIFALVVAWWITEPVPLPVTAIAGAVLAVLFRVGEVKKVFAPFADPIIYLFLGSFLIARAMQVHRLDSRIAAIFLSKKSLRGNPLLLFVFLGLLCALLSMWLSNSAVTAIFYPIALGLLSTCGTEQKRRYAPAVLLLVAYSSSLGGIGTPVGTPPNLIGIAMLQRLGGVTISFFEWMIIATPIFLAGFALFALLLKLAGRLPSAGDEVGEGRLSAGEPLTADQKKCLGVFIGTVILWIVPGISVFMLDEGSSLRKLLSSSIPESVAALIGGIALFFIPSKNNGSGRLLDWSDGCDIDWGTLILFGGGLSLGTLMFDTKLAQFLGEKWLFAFGNPTVWAFTLASIVAGVVTTEFMSNTAAATIIIPVIISVAQAGGISPLPPVMGATIGCSMAFMLPVSTPPNAIVYGSGLVPIKEMIKAGILLDVLMIVITALALRLLLPLYGLA